MADFNEFSTGPKQLITEDKIVEALKTDKGNEARLLSWEIIDFVKKGANMCFYVTSVKIRYSLFEESCNVTYIIKLNPGRHDLPGYDKFVDCTFNNEELFFKKMAPQMRSILTSKNLHSLNVPNCFYSSRASTKQMLIMEDLRKEGFKVCDFSTEFDEDDSLFCIEAIAKFHIASFLLLKNPPFETLNDIRKFDGNTPYDFRFYRQMLWSGVSCTCALLKRAGGYGKATMWLEKYMALDAEEAFASILSRVSSSPFHLICHGDLNRNNILIRYDTKGSPVDIKLVDLQGCAYDSSAKDISYFMYINLTPKIRKAVKEKLLVTYYNVFRKCVEGCEETVNFTYQELRHEFKNHEAYGVLLYLLRVPYMGRQFGDGNAWFEDKTEAMQRELVQRTVEVYDKSPECFREVFELFDELDEEGFFE